MEKELREALDTQLFAQRINAQWTLTYLARKATAKEEQHFLRKAVSQICSHLCGALYQIARPVGSSPLSDALCGFSAHGHSSESLPGFRVRRKLEVEIIS